MLSQQYKIKYHSSGAYSVTNSAMSALSTVGLKLNIRLSSALMIGFFYCLLLTLFEIKLSRQNLVSQEPEYSLFCVKKFQINAKISKTCT